MGWCCLTLGLLICFGMVLVLLCFVCAGVSCVVAVGCVFVFDLFMVELVSLVVCLVVLVSLLLR